MKNIFAALSIIFLFSACAKTLLGPDLEDSPEVVFDELWKGFDEHYGLFPTNTLDWDQVYAEFRPRVNANTSDYELWDICGEMIKLLDDGHTAMFDYVNSRFINSGFGPEQEEVLENFDLELVQSNYLENVKKTKGYDIGQGFLFGKIGNVGYIFLLAFDGDHTNNEFGVWTEEIESVIESFGSDVKGIIVDVRDNDGGFDSNAKRIAGAFASEEKLAYTKRTKNGPGHNDFGESGSHFLKPIGETFTGPVVLITDRGTICASEIFTLLMKQNDRVTHIGDTTWGAFSDVSFQKILLNGWSYQLSHQLYLDPNGGFLDGVGNVPDFFIKNTKEDILDGRDLVLEKAVELLD